MNEEKEKKPSSRRKYIEMDIKLLEEDLNSGKLLYEKIPSWSHSNHVSSNNNNNSNNPIKPSAIVTRSVAAKNKTHFSK